MDFDAIAQDIVQEEKNPPKAVPVAASAPPAASTPPVTATVPAPAVTAAATPSPAIAYGVAAGGGGVRSLLPALAAQPSVASPADTAAAGLPAIPASGSSGWAGMPKQVSICIPCTGTGF